MEDGNEGEEERFFYMNREAEVKKKTGDRSSSRIIQDKAVGWSDRKPRCRRRDVEEA